MEYEHRTESSMVNTQFAVSGGLTFECLGPGKGDGAGPQSPSRAGRYE